LKGTAHPPKPALPSALQKGLDRLFFGLMHQPSSRARLRHLNDPLYYCLIWPMVGGIEKLMHRLFIFCACTLLIALYLMPYAAPTPTVLALQNTPTPESLGNPILGGGGGKIAYASNKGANFDIYVISLDGDNPVRLTDSPSSEWRPTWSPDGRRILYSSVVDGNEDLYVMDADGSNRIRLTDAFGRDSNAVWSPDGKKIAFVSERDGLSEIYVMDADGNNQINITNNNFRDSFPQWSPDGKQIVYEAAIGTANWDVYIIPATGGDPFQLTDHPSFDGLPAWSPDGTTIAFASARDGSSMDIFTIPATGGEVKKLTNIASDDKFPMYSPDGKYIAFYSDENPGRDDNGSILIMNVDGSDVFLLTDDNVHGYYPAWQPPVVTYVRGDDPTSPVARR
jgi:Tol biopolymer transport system component